MKHRIELLGGLRVRVLDHTVTRFRTRKTGLLLAYLALPPGASHPREELIDLFWPELDPPAARSSLSQALSALRRLLEPAGIPAGAVLTADRNAVRLEPALVTTDVEPFEAALRDAEQSDEPVRRAACLSRAVALYRGPLLDGHDEEWIHRPRERLAEAAAAAREALKAREGEAEAGRGLYRPLGRPTPLPYALTRFFGREEELARLTSLLALGPAPRSRLVTLTGPGGSGKTRLAAEAVRRVVATGDEGAATPEAWFVSLADLADARDLMAAVADALGLPRLPEREPLDQVVERLARRPALLVLDNFEHLVGEGAPLLRLLLERAPALTCLVTSRCCLNLEGEQELSVAPLPVPTKDEPTNDQRSLTGGPGGSFVVAPSSLVDCPSVALFLDRAQAVRPEFQLTEENAAAVAALCRGLEGIPLAIELAAARARVLSPAQMVAHLERRFDLLVGPRRDAVARHRTLLGCIRWSLRLLSPEQQRFFARLSVFRGGWTAEAAGEVCSEWRLPNAEGRWEGQPLSIGVPQSPISNSKILDLLTHLREASLLLAEPGDDGVRYRMLDTLREYGREQLPPDEKSALRRRHARYFLKFIQVGEPHLSGPEQKRWLDRLEQEHDNIRAALAWSQAAPEGAELGLGIVGSVIGFWHFRGHWREARRWCETVLANPRAARPTRARAGALRAGATIAWQQGDPARARSWLEESIAISREQGQLRELAYDKMQLGHLLADDGEGEAALAAWRESERFFREQGDARGVALSVNSIGAYLEMAGDEAGAAPLWEESAALFRELGHIEGISWCLDREARVAACAGDFVKARALLEEALAIRREFGHHLDLAVSLRRLARLSRQLGDDVTARALLEEALVVYRELGAARFAGAVLAQLIEIAEAQGAPAAAARYREERDALTAGSSRP